MKFSQTFDDIIIADINAGAIPALMGEPGIGKSKFVAGIAEKIGTRSFTLSCNLLADKADLTGARLVPYEMANGQTEYKQMFYPHADVREAIDYALANPNETPLLFLDEINRSNTDVTSATLSMPTERRIGSIKLPKNLRMIIAGNDKGHVVTLDEASLSRFSIYHVEPDAATLVAILGDSLNEFVKAVLVKHPSLVFERSAPSVIMVDGQDDDDDDTATASFSGLLDAGEEMLQLTTPRTIESLSSLLNLMSRETLQEYLQTPATIGDRETTLLNEIVEAKVGNTGFATQVISEIAAFLAGGAASTGSGATASKPSCYDSLKAHTTVNDLDVAIRGLTDRERSGSLLYAIYERADNKVLIEQLAAQTPALEQEHMQKLVLLGSSSLLHDANVATLTGTATTVGTAIGAIMGAFVTS